MDPNNEVEEDYIKYVDEEARKAELHREKCQKDIYNFKRASDVFVFFQFLLIVSNGSRFNVSITLM